MIIVYVAVAVLIGAAALGLLVGLWAGLAATLSRAVGPDHVLAPITRRDGAAIVLAAVVALWACYRVGDVVLQAIGGHP